MQGVGDLGRRDGVGVTDGLVAPASASSSGLNPPAAPSSGLLPGPALPAFASAPPLCFVRLTRWRRAVLLPSLEKGGGGLGSSTSPQGAGAGGGGKSPPPPPNAGCTDHCAIGQAARTLSLAPRSGMSAGFWGGGRVRKRRGAQGCGAAGGCFDVLAGGSMQPPKNGQLGGRGGMQKGQTGCQA